MCKMHQDKRMNKSTIKTTEHEVERKTTRNPTTVEYDTVNNVSDLSYLY